MIESQGAHLLLKLVAGVIHGKSGDLTVFCDPDLGVARLESTDGGRQQSRHGGRRQVEMENGTRTS